MVKTLQHPDKLVIEWGEEGNRRTVVWTLQTAGAGATKLTIEESGFSGSADDMIASALDSAGGFNQVIVAVKALLEHDARIDLIADHG